MKCGKIVTVQVLDGNTNVHKEKTRRDKNQDMAEKSRYFVVKQKAVPEVLLKVVELC